MRECESLRKPTCDNVHRKGKVRESSVCLFLAVVLDNKPYHLVDQFHDRICVDINQILDVIAKISDGVFDVVFMLVEEVPDFVVINETRDTTRAAVRGYVLDFFDVVEAFGKSLGQFFGVEEHGFLRCWVGVA